MLTSALSKKTIVAYGITAAPLAMLGLPLYIYLPTFYADSLGMKMTDVGLILLLTRIMDMMIDPLIGSMSDRYNSRFGSKKSFILLGALLLAISFYALLHPIHEMIHLWFIFFSMVVYLGWSLISIPYLAWNAHISPHYHDKTSLSASREMFVMLGAILAMALPVALGVSDNPKKSLDTLYIAFILLLIVALPTTLLYVSEDNRVSQKSLGVSYILKRLQSIPSLHRLQGAFLLNALANAIPATLFLLYVKTVLQNETETGMLLLVYFFAGIIALPIWLMISKKTGKRNAWMLSMALASASFAFIPFVGAGDLTLFVVLTLLSGFSLGADMALPTSMQADIAQQLETESVGISGVLFGLWAMLTKLSLALAVGIGFIALGIVDFTPNNLSDVALNTLIFLYATLPVILKICAFLVLRGYNEKR